MPTGRRSVPRPIGRTRSRSPYDAFCARGTSKESVKWIKFTILREPYDANVVYFQDCRKYVFHYSFATEVLDPFRGMTAQQFNAISLFQQNQKAILGTVILPPAVVWPTEPQFREYGIQFVRQEPFTREEIRDLFQLVKSKIAAPADVEAFYFPTFEQQAVAAAHRDWFASQGVPLGSTGRWAEGNTCYSQGWAFGPVKFFPGDRIASAYHSGDLKPGDILLTDGVPAEVPFVAGIISLVPSTPNSHVAILARTYAVPFVHLVLAEDAQRAQELVGRRILLTAYDKPDGTNEVKLIDMEGLVDGATAAQILRLKRPTPLNIAPMESLGVYGVSTEGLSPADVRYVGGKASNFSILHRAVPELPTGDRPDVRSVERVPRSAADARPGPQPDARRAYAPVGRRRDGTGPHAHGLSAEQRRRMDRPVRRRRSDVARFGPVRTSDERCLLRPVGRWRRHLAIVPIAHARPTQCHGERGERPGRGDQRNHGGQQANHRGPRRDRRAPGLDRIVQRLAQAIALNGMYLSDDANEPARWQVHPEVAAATLREEIARRLAQYTFYPPDMQMLSRDLASIRSLFTNPNVTAFGDELRAAVIDVLADPQHGFDPNAMLRFRSSTNVEDSAEFIGAGLYDSYSGCLADALDEDDNGPCACDPNRQTERDIFQAIRQVFASFYNDNAYLERLVRHDVNESQAGMSVVVHHSFPDEIELANGVATFERTGRPGWGRDHPGQPAKSGGPVTNPEDGLIPEEVTATVLPSGMRCAPQAQAGLQPHPPGRNRHDLDERLHEPGQSARPRQRRVRQDHGQDEVHARSRVQESGPGQPDPAGRRARDQTGPSDPRLRERADGLPDQSAHGIRGLFGRSHPRCEQ